jgi:hypothetical protein
MAAQQITFTKEVEYVFEYNGVQAQDGNLAMYRDSMEGLRYLVQPGYTATRTRIPATNQPFQILNAELLGEHTLKDDSEGKHIFLVFNLPDINKKITADYYESPVMQWNEETQTYEPTGEVTKTLSVGFTLEIFN